jgi:DNA-binding transcriptional MerR regulator
MAGMGIGELARRAEVKIANIRFYEESGLMPTPARRAGGHRHYGAEDVRRLVFIRAQRALGFSLDEIRAMMRLVDPGNVLCDEARALAETQRMTIRARIAELQAMEAQLTRHIAACEAICCGGRAPACPILPEIA